MLFRLAIAPLLLCIALVSSAFAESTDCSVPVLLVPDGRITQSTIPQSTTYWYGIYAQANHSYSVEFVPAADNYFNVSRPQFNVISVYSPSDYLQSCRGTSSVTVTANSGYSPVILKNGNGAGRRVSFIAQSSGLHLISATNTAGAGNYTFRAADTTLFNPRWNTNGANDVQWGFFNVSEMVITGLLTLFDVNGQVVASVPFTVPPNGRAARYTGASDMNLPRNLAGAAIFSHNGPPGSVQGDAFIVNSAGLASIPVIFEPRKDH